VESRDNLIHEYFIVSAPQGERLWNDATLIWSHILRNVDHEFACLELYGLSPVELLLVCYCFHKGHYPMNAWLIRCPFDASDDYLKTLVATGSCWSFACRMDRKLESNYIEVCVCSKLLGSKWPVLIHWFKTAVTNNNPFKNSHYEVCILVSQPHKL